MEERILGRGLSSLLKENIRPITSEPPVNIVDIEKIYVNPTQPRKFFDQSILEELAKSITIHGILQPILVKKDNKQTYQIIAGERRYRAAKLAGLKWIPIMIKNINDQQILELALIENIQREALNIMEEARAYEKLVKEFGYTQSEIATSLAKSRSHIANLIRLNQLPNSVQEMLVDGLLSMGKARCLIGRNDAEKLAKKIIEKKLNVRQTEQLIAAQENRLGNTTKSQTGISSKTNFNNDIQRESQIISGNKTANSENEDLVLLADSLSEKIGVKVRLENIGNGGRILIYYDNLEELDLILTRLG